MEAAGERYTFCTKSGKEPATELLPAALRDASRLSLTKEDIEAGKTLVKEFIVPLASTTVTEAPITRFIRVAAKGVKTAALTAPQQRLFNAAAAIVAMSGTDIGSQLGYREDKRFDSCMVIMVLRDPTAWKSIADLLQARRNLNAAQRNIQVAMQADPEALFAKFRIHGREVRLSDLQDEVERASAEVNYRLGRT